MTSNEPNTFQNGIVWFQVIIIGPPSGIQLDILSHLSKEHGTHLPEITEKLKTGKSIPQGINYRLVEIHGASDPAITDLEGAHALIFLVSSESNFDLCKEILFKIYKEYSGQFPLVVLLDKSISDDNTIEQSIELLGLTKLIEYGIPNLRIFSVCKKTGEGLSKAFNWLSGYFSGDGFLMIFTPSSRSANCFRSLPLCIITFESILLLLICL